MRWCLLGADCCFGDLAGCFPEHVIDKIIGPIVGEKLVELSSKQIELAIRAGAEPAELTEREEA